MSGTPLVIAHRGASGYVPEHTLTAYFIAMQAGADFIEPDLVMTGDGVLVARHENEISATTNVADEPRFAARRTHRTIDGTDTHGWFTEDFTLAELKSLRVRERIPQLRPGNARFDGQFEIATLEEILALVQGVQGQRARRAALLGLPAPPPIGIYPETKHPSHFAARGLPMEAALVATLARFGYAGAAAPVWLQSFEVGNLIALAGMTQLRRVQLIEEGGAPYDRVLAHDPRTYADLITPAGLAGIAAYAHAIGPPKSLILARRADGTLGEPTGLVAAAHAAGLALHPWTFRAENHFLPPGLRRGTDPAAHGDLAGEIRAYLAAGIDGFFTDQPEIGVAARDAFLAGGGGA
ncbi:MAG TPA: glycerophosphodiester phosphodiesterase [Steroidobacteraceae bacterium]|nr:glycerophosphodiester phosphodiesterase [Steroidobacteraceae bacterium]